MEVVAGNTAQRRVLTHAGDRIIGHNLIDKHFRDAPINKRIKPTDPGGYPLPLVNTRALLLSQAGLQGAGVFAGTQASAGQGTVINATSEIAETVETSAAIAAAATATTAEVNDIICEIMRSETMTVNTEVAATSSTAEQDGETAVVAESHNAEQSMTVVVTIARTERKQDAASSKYQVTGTAVETTQLTEANMAAQQPALVHDEETTGDEGVIVLPSSTNQIEDQAIGLVEVHQVPEDSDDDLPIITSIPRKSSIYGDARHSP